MPAQNRGLSPRSLAELALVLSRVAGSVVTEAAVPSGDSLRKFWQNCRTLERNWSNQLERWSAAGNSDVEVLARMAPSLFTAEMVARTFATILAELDHAHGTDDMVRVARSAVSGLMRVRNGLLSRLLLIPEAEFEAVLSLERLRRRCDRWTDLLLGAIVCQNTTFEFAFDAERARDFRDDHQNADQPHASTAVDNLISAGMLLTFLQHLPDTPIEEPELLLLMQAILSAIPKTTFHRDGSFRSALEERIAASRMRMEQRAPFSLVQFKHGAM